MSWKDKYDSVEDFINGFAQVSKKIDDKEKWGFINTEGEEVIPCVYDWVVDFKNGLSKVSKKIDGKEKYGFVNTQGKEVVPLVYNYEHVENVLNEYIKKNLLEKFLELVVCNESIKRENLNKFLRS